MLRVIADLVDVTRMHTADPEHRVPHLAFQPDQLSDLPFLPMGAVETIVRDSFAAGVHTSFVVVATISEQTGEEVTPDKIVKGYEYEKDHYVAITEEELEKAHIVIDVQKKVAKLLGYPIAETPDEATALEYAVTRSVA